MSRKKITVAVSSVLLAALICVGATLAWLSREARTTNVVTIGDVSIELAEPQFDELTDGTKHISDVVPGQTVTKDPTVTNTGSHPVYVRATVTIGGTYFDGMTDEEKTQYQAELENGLHVMDGWVKSPVDNKYYYQNILAADGEEGSSSMIFDKVTIPSTWGNELVGKDIIIDIQAEAIQSEYFTPVYGEDQTTIVSFGNIDMQTGVPVE